MLTKFIVSSLLPIVSMTAVALAGVLAISPNQLPAQANTCASNCPPKPIQFEPGTRIEVRVINRARTAITLENALGDRTIQLQPGQQLKFYRGGSTDPNLSVVFWEKTETPLKAKFTKFKTNQLQVELNLAPTKPGDRSFYIRNDGRIETL
jgi:hypothetical protein